MNRMLRASRSIRFKLTALYMTILMIIIVAAGSFVLYAFRTAAEATVDSDLRARLAAVRETLSKRLSDAYSNRLGDDIEGHTAGSAAGVWIQIADKNGVWVHRAEALRDGWVMPPMRTGLPPEGRTQTVIIRRTQMRVLTAPAAGFVVQIALPMQQFADMQRNLQWRLGIALPLVLLMACLGGYWLSGRALQPVDQIADAVERIGTENLGERLLLRGTGDELDRLAGVMNQMLSRLDAAFRLVTQLTADASHELRTPIAIIRTTGEVTRATKHTAEEEDAAWEQVILQSERASDLIDDLLFLARADAGYSDLHFETLDVAEVLHAALDELAILADEAQIRLSSAPFQTSTVRGDRNALHRLFVILLDNALKYTPSGGCVNVELQVEESENQRLAISVTDNGVGIAPEDQPLVFDRFFRVSKDRSRKSGGSGLGLSIAQRLAIVHGGKITVESHLGAGSTFTVHLPLA